jgi:hypothetical protein
MNPGNSFLGFPFFLFLLWSREMHPHKSRPVEVGIPQNLKISIARVGDIGQDEFFGR